MHHSPCVKYGMSSDMMALITSDCGFKSGGRVEAAICAGGDGQARGRQGHAARDGRAAVRSLDSADGLQHLGRDTSNRSAPPLPERFSDRFSEGFSAAAVATPTAHARPHPAGLRRCEVQVLPRAVPPRPHNGDDLADEAPVRRAPLGRSLPPAKAARPNRPGGTHPNYPRRAGQTRNCSRAARPCGPCPLRPLQHAAPRRTF